MSGVQQPGGYPRNPAVGFADVLRQPAKSAATDLGLRGILQPGDLGTPILRLDAMGELATRYGSPRMPLVSADDSYRLILGMGGAAAHGASFQNAHMASLGGQSGMHGSIGPPSESASMVSSLLQTGRVEVLISNIRALVLRRDRQTWLMPRQCS